ncbi:MAG: DUF87 domain-containing protein [Desulfurococcaceae archaeon]
MRKIIEKVLINLGLPRNFDIKIEPPDIVVSTHGEVYLVRILICKDIDLTAEELNEHSALSLLRSFALLLDALPPNTSIYIVKDKLDINKFMRKIMNEIINTQVELENTIDEHSKVKLRVKLNKLEKIYKSLLDGKPFTKIYLVIKLWISAENIEKAKTIADYYESITITALRNHYGLIIERANHNDIVNIVLYELGITDDVKAKSIEIESSKIGFIQPISRSKLNIRERGVIIGFEKETKHPIGIDIDDLHKHLAIIGPTGRGKTTLLASIIEQIASEGDINIVAIDFKGDLRSYICKGVINVVNPVEMPINILEKPPFFNNVEWKLIVLESLSFISGISIEKLSEAFDIVYREGDLAAISKAHEASILIPFIELLNRKPDYDKLINSLRNGVLIDLSGYGTVFQNSYASLLVNMAKHVFLAEKDPINTLFIIDDAWRVIKMRAIVEMVKEGRSRKLGVIISTQNPDDIPQEILENIYNIVFFGSKNEEYLLKAKKILGLPNQMVSVLSKLTIGEAVFLNLLNKTPLVFEINTPLKYNDRSRV